MQEAAALDRGWGPILHPVHSDPGALQERCLPCALRALGLCSDGGFPGTAGP